jgi:hypothetical protein
VPARDHLHMAMTSASAADRLAVAFMGFSARVVWVVL